MKKTYPSLVVAIPDWVAAMVEAAPTHLETLEDRMRLAIALARENVNRGGGPFGALIVEADSGKVVAPGVNLVMPLNCSQAHAEIVAISIAEQVRGCYDLGAPDMPALQLVTSTEPCAMCLGAVAWSGVRSLVCGACGDDAEKVGFDEGDKPEGWPEALAARGVRVVRDVCKGEAADVLADYANRGGPIYNGSARAGRVADGGLTAGPRVKAGRSPRE